MDRVLFRTAQPADTQTKSNLEIYASGIGKFFTLFKSDLRKQLGLLISHGLLAKDGKYSKAKFTQEFVTQWILYGLVFYAGGAIFRAMAHDDDDDRPVWDWKEAVTAMLLGPIEGAGLFGSAMATAIRMTTGSRTYTNGMNPMENTVRRSYATLTNGEFEWKDILQSLNLASSLASMKDPRLGLIPAAIRGGEQLYNIADNTNESEEEAIARLDREFNANARDAAKAKSAYITDLAESNADLSGIDAETRRAVEKKRKANAIEENDPPHIASLKRMSPKTRMENINHILAGLEGPMQKDRFRAQLRQYGIEPPK